MRKTNVVSATARMVALATALLLAQHAVAGPENLLPNGSFEKGMDGWAVESETGTLKVEIDGNPRAAAGKASAHLSKPSANGNANDRLQIDLRRIPAGKKVVVSAQIMGKGLQNCWLKFFVFDGKGEVLIEDCDIGRWSGTFDWREVDRKFELPKEAVRAEIRLCMFMGGEAWLDDVRVVGDASAARDRSPVATGETKREPIDADLRKWLDGNATKLRTLDLREPLDDLAPLKEILRDARIVQLGENTHGDGACFEAKARLVRFLHEEMGFDVLAFESGLWECDRANELLRKGDADGAMTSSVFGIWHVAPVRSLFRYLAERSRAETPLVLAGFDCRRSAGRANRFVDDLGDFLEPAGGAAEADLAALRRLETLMWEQGDEYQPPEKDVGAALAAWERLRTRIEGGREKLVGKHGEAEVAFVARCLDNWRDNEAFERSKVGDEGDMRRSSNLRDAHMAANLRWLADTRYAGKKIITWGATIHLCHGLSGVQMGGRPDFYASYGNMGEAVHEAFGKSCYTVGFAAHGGQWGIRGARHPVPAPKDGSVEDLLHRYGAPFLFLDLRRNGPFAKPLAMAPMGYGRDIRARWPDVLDAVVFIDEMTPAR